MQSVAMSTCWNSRRHKDGAEMLREIADLGFEYAELSHAISYSLWPGVVEAVEAGVIRISSLHNFCPVPMGVLQPSPNCYEFTDERFRIRNQAIKATQETIRQAKKLGARAVVLHLGSAGPRSITPKLAKLYREGKALNRAYCNAKLEAVRKRRELSPVLWERVRGCLEKIIPDAREAGIKLGVEVREDFEEFPTEEEMEMVFAELPEDVVGYWHDFGHAQRREFLGWVDHESWLRRRHDQLVGCHIHDCAPPLKDHQALGDGEIDFPALVPTLPDCAIPVLELHPRLTVDQVQSCRTQWNSYAATLV